MYITNWSRAEKLRATLYFSCPSTTSEKGMRPPLSASLDNSSRIALLYSWISNGGCLSYHKKHTSLKPTKRRNGHGLYRQQKWKWDNITLNIITCSSKLCSIFCFHVQTRVAISVCFSVSAMLARSVSYTENIVGDYLPEAWYIRLKTKPKQKQKQKTRHDLHPWMSTSKFCSLHCYNFQISCKAIN